MITIVASFELKPECVEEFRALAADCIEGSRKEAGNVDYNLYVSRSDQNRYFFIENWKDEDAIEFHNATEHFQKFSSAFTPLLTGAPVIEHIERV